MMKIELIHGDCLDVLKDYPDDYFESIVTDPPYGLSTEPNMSEVLNQWLSGSDYQHRGGGFMGKTWDSFVPGPAIWKECLRVLKPGGHLLSFFGSRTYDLGVTAIRLAGFEIRDQIMWVYGSGFPKSLNISKALDKVAGAERKVIGRNKNYGVTKADDGKLAFGDYAGEWDISLPASEQAQLWDGWGTGIKPAHEPIVLARKPFKGSVAHNILVHGVGALNIDACRIDSPDGKTKGGRGANYGVSGWQPSVHYKEQDNKGRWPANFIHDGLQGESWTRYFYCPKATKTDRNEGLTLPFIPAHEIVMRQINTDGLKSPRAGAGRTSGGKNYHPTVKPMPLMAWLCKLVTPPGGKILDPFMGSGSTGKGALSEGFNFYGIEMDEGYYEISFQRVTSYSHFLEGQP